MSKGETWCCGVSATGALPEVGTCSIVIPHLLFSAGRWAAGPGHTIIPPGDFAWLAAFRAGLNNNYDFDMEAEDHVCVVPFEAVVRHGPSAGLTLRGTLAVRVDPSGRIDDGVLLQSGGPNVGVVGHATGRAIILLFQLEDRHNLYGVGTLEHDIRECRGAMGGPFVGPLAGDSGDWETGAIDPIAQAVCTTCMKYNPSLRLAPRDECALVCLSAS